MVEGDVVNGVRAREANGGVGNDIKFSTAFSTSAVRSYR